MHAHPFALAVRHSLLPALPVRADLPADALAARAQVDRAGARSGANGRKREAQVEKGRLGAEESGGHKTRRAECAEP
eukprot:6205244-Pleurochrysis_carterae.AAC.4